MKSLHPLRAALRSSSARPRQFQCLHTTSAKPATPLPHPTTPGPPPQPPTPSILQPSDRVARKRRQAELLEKSQALKANPSKPKTALQKRFWKDTSVKETPEGYEILLDARPVRTPSKSALTVPLDKPHLATAIALEWDLLVSAQQALKQQYIPLTSLLSRALDIQHADEQGNAQARDDIVRMVMKYLNTDTLLCWAPEKSVHDAVDVEAYIRTAEGEAQSGASGSAKMDSLRQQQMRAAKPIIAHLTTHVWPGVEVLPILAEDSILPTPQPPVTREVIRGWISGLPAYELAALERGVLASKSLLVATRLLVEWSQEFAGMKRGEGEGQKRFGIEQAADAATLEVRWQTRNWGEVEDTHDVDREDIRRQLGSVIMLVR